LYQFKHSRFGSHAQILQKVQRVPVPSRILDVGGGEGYLSTRLAASGRQVVCLAQPNTTAGDLTKDNIEIVEADLDVEKPPLTGGFDVIVCGDVLEHLRNPSDALTWLAGMLKSDGVLVGSVPNGVHLYIRLKVLSGQFPKHDRGLFDRTHLHFFSWDGWHTLLDACGLQVTELTVTPVPFSLLCSGRSGFVLESIALAGARLWRSLLAYQFVFVAKNRRT